VAEPWLPPLDFQAYLEAKAPIDSGSLDPGLFARFRRSFEAQRDPRLLDLGTGTGAMLRRVLALRPAGPMELAGLDSEARSLERARRCIAEQLRGQGCRLREQAETAGWRLEAESGTRLVRVRLVRGNLLDPGAAALFPEPGFGFLTAHAFLDLLPLERALRIIRPLLAPGGLLYSTLNYDGSTALLPPDRDPGFEQSLLAAYDHSMETRCVGGQPTGGAFSGRRLRAALERGGFRVLGAGRSDWNVLPVEGRHAPGAAFFLQALLGMIAGEGLRAPGIDPEELEAWWRRRSADIRAGRLGLRARNQDLLAQRS
jgi:SAM-dependent methyltransferase